MDIRVLVLRTVFRVVRLSADQRASQKKEEYRFSIFYREKLTPQGRAHRSIQVMLGMYGQLNCNPVLSFNRIRI